MKARQKWSLLVLNSEGYENLLMSNLRNFQKFYAFFGADDKDASYSKME